MNTIWKNKSLLQPIFNFKRNAILLVNVFFSFILLSGCAGTGMNRHITTFSTSPVEPRNNAQDIRIYKIGEQPEGSYEVVGKVFVETLKRGWGSGASDEFITKSIKPLASNMGADAITGFYIRDRHDKGKSGNRKDRWGSGLAIKFPSNSNNANTQGLEFVVAIPKPHVAPTTTDKDSLKALEKAALIRDVSQYWLEKKGYYATQYQTTFNQVNSDLISALDDDSLNAVFGPQPELILLIESVTTDGTNIGIAAGNVANLRLKLYSRSSRSIIWESTGEGGAVNLGLVPVLFGGDRRSKEAIFKALKKAFESLEQARGMKSEV